MQNKHLTIVCLTKCHLKMLADDNSCSILHKEFCVMGTDFDMVVHLEK